MKDSVHDIVDKISEDPESDYILIAWHIDDVRSRECYIRDTEISVLTDRQCRDILKCVKRSFDASYGISWETFDTYILNTLQIMEDR